MGEIIRLKAADGHALDAYLANPTGLARGGIVIMQEIFGLTGHIRRIVDQYANQGFLTIAPSLFDRIEPGIVLDYADVEKGRELMMTLERDGLVADMTAAVAAARAAGKVAAIGYCWGGAMADLAACRAGVDAAVSYYGRATVGWLDEQPRCPVLYHYGAEDPLIPPELIEQISAGRPGQQSYIYEAAGHGFNCDERDDYRPESAALALARTLDFLEDNL
ncbi:MAG: dienelactone hydrolase family protein [Gammaproteobacteria bacterium]|nr:dienelactone hydrolase family protein [Gammaproteobacteria bacterium]MBT8443379.1 dienelactone hydrolase family protein [Gammaproteobacteria bacterium]NND35994.1 dienelactone hydrolase family protein [Gammaproteobacteria bacterium]